MYRKAQRKKHKHYSFKPKEIMYMQVTSNVPTAYMG